MLKELNTLDAVFITLMAACGLAVKPIVGPFFKLIGSALLIPSGSMAGAVYMIWPMLALFVVKRFGTAAMVGLIQGIVVMVTGIYGSHGVLTLMTYTLPGVVIDIVYSFLRHSNNVWLMMIPAAAGNLSGALLVGIAIMHLPRIPLLIALVPAFIFGALGGYFSWIIYQWFIKAFPIFNKADSR